MANWNHDRDQEREFLMRLASSGSIERQRRNRQRRVSGATLMAWVVMLVSAAIVLLMIAAGR